MTLQFDALLVHHHTDNPHRPILVPAVGLLGLADHLSRHGIRCQAINLGVERAVDPTFDLVDYVASTQAKVVGFSAHWYFQLPDSLAAAEAVKRAHPNVCIVFGGFSASLFAADIIQEFWFVDVAVRGDGELPFLELCRAVVDREDGLLAAVPNLVFRQDGGTVQATPFSYVATEAELREVRYANMELLKNRQAFFEMKYYPTQRFTERFKLAQEGVLAIETGRGCPFSCTLCGGNREAQKIIFNRSRPVFQPPEAVLANIRQAMSYGYRNFYLCFDPDPRGPYYHELFASIRQEKLPIRFMFESWGLPTERFVDDFADTFDDGLIVLSPDSADEEVRARNKGSLAFSNDELRQRVGQIERRGLVCHLFFGYLLPGDTRETVLETRRFASDYQGGQREVFHLAFSTDPCSPVHLHPEEHDVQISVRTMNDYLDALAKKRLSPNLLIHRPKSMPVDVANELLRFFAIEQLLRKLAPASLEMVRQLARNRDELHGTVEHLCFSLARSMPADQLELDVVPLITQALELVDGIGGERDSPALQELFDFEATPYRLFEERFRAIGLHYTSRCTEVALSEAEREQFIAATATATITRHYEHDVAMLARDLKEGRAANPKPRALEVTWAVDETGRFCIRTSESPAEV